MIKSFRCALRGVWACIKTERNFRIHLVCAFYVLIAAAVTGLPAAQWAAVLLCIGCVTGAEVLNTAVERLCDALHPRQSAGIGLVKDLAAGAVLMAAAASAVAGGLIFFNRERLDGALRFAARHPVLAALVAATAPAAFYFVFRRYTHDHKNCHDNHCGPAQRREIHPRQHAGRGKDRDCDA